MPVKKKDFIGLVLFLCTHVKIFLFNVWNPKALFNFMYVPYAMLKVFADFWHVLYFFFFQLDQIVSAVICKTLGACIFLYSYFVKIIRAFFARRNTY